MREIKFRAWHNDLNIMSRTFNINDWRDLAKPIFAVENFEVAVADGIALMQYTGLKDKHGKEIYEGDIVCFDKDNPSVKPKVTVPVFFENGMFQCGTHSNLILSHVSHVVEIVGNIYEFPELLGSLKCT